MIKPGNLSEVAMVPKWYLPDFFVSDVQEPFAFTPADHAMIVFGRMLGYFIRSAVRSKQTKQSSRKCFGEYPVYQKWRRK